MKEMDIELQCNFNATLHTSFFSFQKRLSALLRCYY